MAANTPEITQDYLFREFLSAKPGKEAEVAKWNAEQHLQDIAVIPGVLSARLYELADDQLGQVGPAKGKFMNTYHVRAPDVDAFVAELDKRRKSGAVSISPDVDPDSVEYYSFHLLKKAFVGSAGLSAMDPGHPDYLEQIFDNPTDGSEDAFNAWYDGYIQGLMANPQFINAYRGLVSQVSFGKGKHSSKYFAQLAFRAPDVSVLANSLKTTLPLNPAVKEGEHFAYTYKANGGYLMGEPLKALREARG